MIPEYVRGPIAPVFTAFNADGSLDDAGQRHFLDFLLKSDAISAYFVRSGMGQMYTFSLDDVLQLARNACSHLDGKAPVLVGCAGIWDRNRETPPDPNVYVAQAVELSRAAEAMGAAGVVHTLPEAIIPEAGQTPTDVVLDYFETIHTSVNLPIFIYQPPGTNKEFRVTVNLARKLADMPNIKGIKVSTADAAYILDICWATADKDFAFIVGNETAFYAGLCSGARAVVGQGACICPRVLKAVQERFGTGDYRGAINAQRSVNVLVHGCPAPVEFLKRYAAEKGYRVQPYSRATNNCPCSDKGSSLTQGDYNAYKKLLESELSCVLGEEPSPVSCKI